MFRELKQLWDTFTCVGRLICPEGQVSSLNKSNPIQTFTCVGLLICPEGHVSSLNKSIPIQSKSHILSRGPRTTCHHCGQTLSIDHMLLECAVLQESRDEYYTADSMNTLWDNSWDLHCGIPARSGILLSDMNGQTFYTIPKLMQLSTSWILHSKLLEDRLWDDPRGLHDKSFWEKLDSLSDINGHISSTLFKSVSNWRDLQLNNITRLSL